MFLEDLVDSINWIKITWFFKIQDTFYKINENYTENFANKCEKIGEMCEEYDEYLRGHYYLGDGYLNRSINLEGTLLITDPCYLRHGCVDESRPWFEIEEAEEKMEEALEEYLFENEERGLANSTLYGDWSCNIFKTDKKEKYIIDNSGNPVTLGEFCADSGMVCVTTLEEVNKINPNFKRDTIGDWCITFIDNFKGNVEIRIEEEFYTYEGEEHKDYVCYLVGHGINMVTGEEIHFRTSQTGF